MIILKGINFCHFVHSWFRWGALLKELKLIWGEILTKSALVTVDLRLRKVNTQQMRNETDFKCN